MNREHITAVERLLSGLSDIEVRELCLAALRQCRADRAAQRLPVETAVSLHGHLGLHMVPLLAKRKGETLASLKGERYPGFEHANQMKEVFIRCLGEPWMAGVFEFVVWFTRAGLGVPLVAGGEPYPITIRLTRAGERLLDQAADHPLLPDAIERVCSRCPDLPDDVAGLLADARACVEHGLLRPSISVLGVAYEVAIEAVVESLITKVVLPGSVADAGAAIRIRDVKAKIDSVLPGATMQERDARFSTHAAYDFANTLRRRRNDASHTTPTYGFDDREETEQLFVSALHHLPNLWRMH